MWGQEQDHDQSHFEKDESTWWEAADWARYWKRQFYHEKGKRITWQNHANLCEAVARSLGATDENVDGGKGEGKGWYGRTYGKGKGGKGTGGRGGQNCWHGNRATWHDNPVGKAGSKGDCQGQEEWHVVSNEKDVDEPSCK